MFWLKLLAVLVIVTLGIFVISYLEETFVSGPRRKELQRKAREKLEGAGKPQ